MSKNRRNIARGIRMVSGGRRRSRRHGRKMGPMGWVITIIFIAVALYFSEADDASNEAEQPAVQHQTQFE